MKRSKFMVPAPIMSYNILMNSVDKFDHLRSTCPILRKERRVNMSIFSWVLDAACINAITLQSIVGDDSISLFEYK